MNAKWTTVLAIRNGTTVRLGRCMATSYDIECLAISLGKRVSWQCSENDRVATFFYGVADASRGRYGEEPPKGAII